MGEPLPIAESHNGEAVAPVLAPFLERVYIEIERPESDLHTLVMVLRALLRFLASPEGRASANCWATDLFFMRDEHWSERRWAHLPQPLQDMLADMGGALHDSVDYPEIAENFDSTPDQLLARLETFTSGGQLA